jgi:hypothetical protein
MERFRDLRHTFASFRKHLDADLELRAEAGPSGGGA